MLRTKVDFCRPLEDLAQDLTFHLSPVKAVLEWKNVHEATKCDVASI